MEKADIQARGEKRKRETKTAVERSGTKWRYMDMWRRRDGNGATEHGPHYLYLYLLTVRNNASYMFVSSPAFLSLSTLLTSPGELPRSKQIYLSLRK